MATSGENYWPPTGRTSWPLTAQRGIRGGCILCRDEAEPDCLSRLVCVEINERAQNFASLINLDAEDRRNHL